MSRPRAISATAIDGHASYARTGDMASLRIRNKTPVMKGSLDGFPFADAVAYVRQNDINRQSAVFRVLMEKLVAQLGPRSDDVEMEWVIPAIEPFRWEVRAKTLLVHKERYDLQATLAVDPADSEASTVAAAMEAALQGRIRELELRYQQLLAGLELWGRRN